MIKDEYEADMALRVYTTHLLGQNPSLVLHGGAIRPTRRGPLILLAKCTMYSA